MAKDLTLLSDDLVIVLAQALTGLGHLRVSHALYHGLPAGAHSLLLSSQDDSINYMHKITSINPFLRRVMEFTQGGLAEGTFTFVARQYFRRNIKILEDQLQTILDQHVVRPKTLLVVATHTNLAHQLASIKEEFEKKNSVRVVLVVVVTDDSPQHIWAVGGADLIIVPSELTKRKLAEYHNAQMDMTPSHYKMLPYMVSPRLARALPSRGLVSRTDQLDGGSHVPIHVAIPISGAAVQLAYFEKLLANLKKISTRFTFHIVSLETPATSRFLARQMGGERTNVSASLSHRDVVELYEKLYEKQVIALEVTKPSEQSFKALLSPRRRGGAILLFSDPVGRQEYDNLRFLVRHNLVPNAGQQKTLWSWAMRGETPEGSVLAMAKSWRGLLLPFHSAAGAEFISWCLKEKLFSSMMDFAGYEKSPELSSRGVVLFWKTIGDYLEKNIMAI